jgi:hypothetical protein
MEGVEQKQIVPTKIPEEFNAADIHTKYLVYARWKRHATHMCNLTDGRERKCRERMSTIVLKLEDEDYKDEEW